jgi:hypothetical protein
MNSPQNIIVWTLTRTGSTAFQQLLARGLYEAHGPDVKNMQEATGIGGIMHAYSVAMHMRTKIDFGAAVDPALVPEEIKPVGYTNWQIDNTGSLRMKEMSGNPVDEVHNRLDLIKSGNWKNHVVFKNMRWTLESSHLQQLNMLFEDAMINSQQSFHHVVLWRKNIFDMVASRVAMKYTGLAHGVYGFDGKPFEAHKVAYKEFGQGYQDTVDEFIRMLPLLDQQRTVMVETEKINSLEKIEWRDGTVLTMPDRASIVNKDVGINRYVHKHTKEEIRPIDMLGVATKEIAFNLANTMQQKYDWDNLGTKFGFKSYI